MNYIEELNRLKRDRNMQLCGLYRQENFIEQDKIEKLINEINDEYDLLERRLLYKQDKYDLDEMLVELDNRLDKLSDFDTWITNELIKKDV